MAPLTATGDGMLAGPSTVGTLVDVDRGAILRAPQAILFGKNASAGLVSITTKQPKLGGTSLSGRAANSVPNAICSARQLPTCQSWPTSPCASSAHREREGIVTNVDPAFPECWSCAGCHSVQIWHRPRLGQSPHRHQFAIVWQFGPRRRLAGRKLRSRRANYHRADGTAQMLPRRIFRQRRHTGQLDRPQRWVTQRRTV